MTEREALLQQLHNILCGDLDRIKKRFNCINGTPKVSLIVRFENPEDPEKGVWLTDDTAEAAIAYIRYMEEQNALGGGAIHVEP